MKSADGGGELWLDDITVNGQTEDFSKDLGWDSSKTGARKRPTSSGRALTSASAPRASPAAAARANSAA